jgi:tetratricopeptide (TPR) repeat protein
MAPARFSPRESIVAVLFAALLLAACGSAPKVSEPVLRKQAQETERDGARRYARGDYAGAARHFAVASQLQQSLDDPAAAARNQLHQARAELAASQAEAALNRAKNITHAELVLDALLLQAQAHLALGKPAAAQKNLTAATASCAANCPQSASLNLLQARVALVDKRAADALRHAEAALKLLQGKDEAAETGNAWRLIATARLAGDDAAGALPAAQAALDIDRQLALPEKIARDWLLIGDIRKKLGAGGTAAAYQRALDVASAASLQEIAGIAAQAINEVKPPQGNTR